MDVNGDEALVDNELVNASGIYRHLASNVAQVFAYPSCGNTICEEPDEFPFWRAAEDARALPGGCVFDCGSIATVEVTITFFDAFKYLAAVDLVESLAYQDLVRGFTPLQWGVVDEAGALLRRPVAGWNVCSKTDALYGHFEKVCVFDGDVQIDGAAYRTSELTPRSASFGATKTVSLYEGDWEVVYAFANFSWPHPKTGEDVLLAHPALRGTLCVAGACETWGPCQGRKRVIQRRFNVGVLEAIPKRKASTL